MASWHIFKTSKITTNYTLRTTTTFLENYKDVIKEEYLILLFGASTANTIITETGFSGPSPFHAPIGMIYILKETTWEKAYSPYMWVLLAYM